MNPYEAQLQPPVLQAAPDYLIIPAEEPVRAFLEELGGPNAITRMDMQEILTQIVEVLLNDDEFSERELLKLPNEDRLLDANRIEQARLKQAVYHLGRYLRELLLSYGAYTPEYGFPYIFHSLIGCDIKLQRLSY